jgi:hypothetical protein
MAIARVILIIGACSVRRLTTDPLTRSIVASTASGMETEYGVSDRPIEIVLTDHRHHVNRSHRLGARMHINGALGSSLPTGSWRDFRDVTDTPLGGIVSCVRS